MVEMLQAGRSRVRFPMSVLSFAVDLILTGARGSVVGWGTKLHAERSQVRVPMKWIFQFT
jgi:hypothetical protein